MVCCDLWSWCLRGWSRRTKSSGSPDTNSKFKASLSQRRPFSETTPLIWLVLKRQASQGYMVRQCWKPKQRNKQKTSSQTSPSPIPWQKQVSHYRTCRNSRSRPGTQVTPIWTVWVNRNGVKSAGDYPKIQSVAGPQELWNTLTKKVESLGLQPEISQGGHEPTPAGLEMLAKYVRLDQLVITIFSC